MLLWPVLQVGQRWRQLGHATAGGRALLDAWGYQEGDAEGVTEALTELSARYANEDSCEEEL